MKMNLALTLLLSFNAVMLPVRNKAHWKRYTREQSLKIADALGEGGDDWGDFIYNPNDEQYTPETSELEK